MLIHPKWGDQLQRKFANTHGHFSGFVLSIDSEGGNSMPCEERHCQHHCIQPNGNEEAQVTAHVKEKMMPGNQLENRHTSLGCKAYVRWRERRKTGLSSNA